MLYIIYVFLLANQLTIVDPFQILPKLGTTYTVSKYTYLDIYLYILSILNILSIRYSNYR